MDSGVEQYVQGLIAEGGAKETLGFTLDQARALKKLSKSQLPDEALWIVKMVQAAVRGEATEVICTKVHFCSADVVVVEGGIDEGLLC